MDKEKHEEAERVRRDGMKNNGKKSKKQILLIIIISVVLLAAAVILYLMGIIGNPVNKIAGYALNTYEEFQLPKDMDVSKYTNDGDYHVTISAETDMLEANMEYDTDGETEQYIMNNELDLWLTTLDISTVCQIQDQKVSIQIPSISNTIYCYSLNDDSDNPENSDDDKDYDDDYDDDGYSNDDFGEPGVAFIQGVADMEMSSSAGDILSKFVLNHRFAYSGKADMTLGEKITNCTAYKVEAEGEEIYDLYEDIISEEPEAQDFLSSLHDGDAREKLLNGIKNAGTVRLTVYCGKEVIAGVRIEAVNSDKVITLDMDVLAEAETVKLRYNSKPYVDLRYHTKKKVLTVALDGDTDNLFRVEFQDGKSYKSFVLDGIESIAALAGGMESLEDENSMLGMLFTDMISNSDISMTVSFSDDSVIRTLNGRKKTLADAGDLTMTMIIRDLVEAYWKNENSDENKTEAGSDEDISDWDEDVFDWDEDVFDWDEDVSDGETENESSGEDGESFFDGFEFDFLENLLYR